MGQLEMVIRRSRETIEPFASDERGRWHLVHGDAADVLARVPDHCVDVLYADPPYALSSGGTTCSGGERAPVDKGEWDRPLAPEESLRFHERWLEQARLALAPTGTLWVSGTHHVIFDVGYALRRLGFHVLNLVTWHKPAPPPHLAGRYLAHSTEQIIWAAPRLYNPLRHVFHYQDMKRENGGKQLKDVWSKISPPRGAERARGGGHTTQKPEALLRRIIRMCAPPNAYVVDPFSGSSTTGAVALSLGHRYLGIDMDAGYLENAARRLAEVAR